MADDEEDISSDGLEEFGPGRFYRGVLLRLQRGRQRGVVRAGGGREIPFEFVHTVLLGERTRWEDLHEGMEIGYDVGWTSSGLRVTAIKANE